MLISACKPVQPRALTGKRSKQMMNRTSRNKPPQSHWAAHRTRVRHQPKWPTFYSTDFSCRKVALANITHFIFAPRQTGKRMEVSAQQEGLIMLYRRYWVQELNSQVHKAKGLLEKTESLTVISFVFSFRDVNYFPPCMIQLAEFNSSCECYEFYTFKIYIYMYI